MNRTADVATPTLPDDDARLMLAVQRGESAAFQELLDKHRSNVFGRFYRTFGNRQDAEDLTQDVFLRVYRARKTYRPTARFDTWLYHIVQNVSRNAVRTQRRRPLRCIGVVAEDAKSTARARTTLASQCPTQRIERRELAGLVRAAVSDLARRQRRAVELYQFQHHSYAQVAEHMDMTPKAAKSLLYRARIELKRQLAKVVDVQV